MAKECSFDVVSEVDLQEVDNAYGQTTKELAQRYDLKGSGAEIEFDKHERKVVVTAPSDFVARQVIDVFQTKMVRRQVDLKSIKWSDPVPAASSMVKITGTIVAGIDQDIARHINKDIKAEKLKVKVQIEGDKVRVFSMSRDALQEVIAFLKDKDYGVPLQYTNYR
jgi:cyclic-di-GMP-binding protein